MREQSEGPDSRSKPISCIQTNSFSKSLRLLSYVTEASLAKAEELSGACLIYVLTILTRDCEPSLFRLITADTSCIHSGVFGQDVAAALEGHRAALEDPETYTAELTAARVARELQQVC